jgi:aryl-alcohol dehydrogenase-like predicted oxidoreductase
VERRFLGRSGLEVSVLSFGLMTFGDGAGFFSAIGSTQGAAAARQVAIAMDAGINLFDTSDNYSEGQSEQILGDVLGTRRKDVLIATKAYGRTGAGDHDVGLSRRHLLSACDASLRRLKTDWIDLYQVHNFDGLVPLEETLRTLDDLVRCGKVRYAGCSNHFAWQLTKALGVSERLSIERYISQQIQYSLLVRDAEVELLPAGSDQGVGALVYSPLAQGYLAGKYGGDAASGRLAGRGHLRFLDTERGRTIINALQRIAAAHDGATPSQVALNWLLQRSGVTSVILGARTEAQLLENLGTVRWRLSPEEMEDLDRLSATAKGYPRSARDVFHPERNPVLFPRTTQQ